MGAISTAQPATRRTMIAFLALTALAALVIFGAQTTTRAQGSSSAGAAGRIITVSGQGVITVIPDLARISIGVSTQNKTAAAALRANNGAMNEVIGNMKRAGIAARDMQTSNLTVQPRQQRYRDGRPPKVTGYFVSNQLRLTVRRLNQLGALLDDLVAAGANQIHGITFEVSNAGKMRDAARGSAVEDARRKAELYAKAAGARLGEIVSITEQGTSGGRPIGFGRAMSVEAVPVERGSKALHVRVSASWRLE